MEYHSIVELQRAHARQDCDKDIICHFCEQEGHKSAQCPLKLYGGEYAEEILDNQVQDQDTGSVTSGTLAPNLTSVSMCLSDNESNHENGNGQCRVGAKSTDCSKYML